MSSLHTSRQKSFCHLFLLVTFWIVYNRCSYRYLVPVNSFFFLSFLSLPRSLFSCPPLVPKKSFSLLAFKDVDVESYIILGHSYHSYLCDYLFFCFIYSTAIFKCLSKDIVTNMYKYPAI